MHAKISVILPTHNPRRDFLERTVAALREQSLPPTAWEFVIVDNASREPVASLLDLDWHPGARIVTEPQRGKSHALIRGVDAVQGDALVFVDDDNLLAPDYLHVARDFFERRPWLGAWGAGRIVAEFEVPPAKALEAYLGRLALRHYDQEWWSNNVDDWPATPVGAGLCLRRPVAEHWAARVATEFALATSIERVGGDLINGEDIIMALSARHFGLGWATSPALTLTHLIPRRRVTKEYLLSITEGQAMVDVLNRAHTARRQPRKTSNIKHLYRLARLLMQRRFVDVEFLRARERGIRRGEALVAGDASTNAPAR